MNTTLPGRVSRWVAMISAVMLAAIGLAARSNVVAVLPHDLNSAAVYADRLVLLDHGRVVADGPPAQVCTAERLTSFSGTPLEVFEVHGVTRVAPYRTRT